MKRALPILLTFAALIAAPLYWGVKGEVQESVSLKVDVAVICRNIVDREPADAGSSFEATVGKLYCFTKIIDAQPPVEITHVWYFGETERGRVALQVGSASWRTWSSKTIQANEVGTWHVDVLGPDGQVLKTIQFEITQQED